MARYKTYTDGYLYRVYVTDTLYYQAENQHLTLRYEDLINKKFEQETRTAEAIAADIIQRHGLIEKG